MRRRDFIKVIAGAAAIWPLAARAQRPDRLRRIGVLIGLAENDPEAQNWISAFTQRLQELGWTTGRNVRIDYRWAGGVGESIRAPAAELVAMAPDVILADGTLAVLALQNESRTVPIVFVQAPDPVGIGIVPSLAHPGGNVTGFTHFEYPTAGKWLEALKEIAPRTSRALVLVRNPTPNTPGAKTVAAIGTVALTLGVQLTAGQVMGAAEIERAINAFAAEPNGGLIALPNTITSIHRELIVALAARYRMPAVYPYRHFVTAGGLLSYNIDTRQQFRQAASYVDRILKGEKPADLPVQQPTKFELVINLKTAKALGLDVPPMLLARADAVIE